MTSRRKWPELQRRMGLPTAHPNLHPGVIRWVRAGYSQRRQEDEGGLGCTSEPILCSLASHPVPLSARPRPATALDARS